MHRSAAHLHAFRPAVLSDVLVYMHRIEYCCMHVRQVGVDKIRLRGKLRVTLPLFDELPCVAGIQASALPLPISHIMFQRVVSPPIVADMMWQYLLQALVPVVFGNRQVICL